MSGGPPGDPGSGLAAFLRLLPLCLGLNWAFGICTSSIVLQTLALARDAPTSVLLMPQLLRVTDAKGLSGAVFSLFSLGIGVMGTLAGKFADHGGMRFTGAACTAILLIGSVLSVFPFTYLIGMIVLSVGVGSTQAVSEALFISQFDDDRQTQKYVTYLYAITNLFFLLATVCAGIQPFWLGYVQSAVFSAVGLAGLLLSWGSLRDVAEAGRGPAEEVLVAMQHAAKGGILAEKSAKEEQAREQGFAVLCVFTLLFFMTFSQFIGGPFMLFAQEKLGGLGGINVPAQWFLGLNGLVDLLLAMPISSLYRSRRRDLRFFSKLCISFLFSAAACAVVAVAASSSREDRGVSPFTAAVAVILISIGELHYDPVMMAAISTEMPENKVGLFTGIHCLLSGVGESIAGVGVPLYKSMGPVAYFGGCSVVCMAAAGSLQLASPFLASSFKARPERQPLQPCSLQA